MTVDTTDHPCPVCLVGPGEPCYATATDEPRPQPHRLRGLAAVYNLVPCACCRGVGWRPDNLETKDR